MEGGMMGKFIRTERTGAGGSFTRKFYVGKYYHRPLFVFGVDEIEKRVPTCWAIHLLPNIRLVRIQNELHIQFDWLNMSLWLYIKREWIKVLPS
jgi:hypothetical protein